MSPDDKLYLALNAHMRALGYYGVYVGDSTERRLWMVRAMERSNAHVRSFRSTIVNILSGIWTLGAKPLTKWQRRRQLLATSLPLCYLRRGVNLYIKQGLTRSLVAR